MTAPRWLPVAAVTLFAACLAWANRGERVALDLGFATFYRAPLAFVLLLSFLAGMMAMLWLGLRQDRRVRDELRRHGLLPPAQAEPTHPVPSAWGVAREPAREDEGERTRAWGASREPSLREDDDERTIAYPRYDEDPAA